MNFPPDIKRIRGAVDEVSKRVGCGDSSCKFTRPSGMATNGGCRCEQGPFVVSALANLYRVTFEELGGAPSRGDRLDDVRREVTKACAEIARLPLPEKHREKVLRITSELHRLACPDERPPCATESEPL